MLSIYLENNNPFFCLAAEEYLLKNFSEDIFMIWQSEKTVVVGKHQNIMEEVNLKYVRDNAISIARRISGGGTVFHDRGNVNFTFIKNVASPSEISFTKFTQPIVEALAVLGVNASTSGRNDLVVNGLKISGNAEHVYKNRVLHHGTLLFNSGLAVLGNAIKADTGKYKSKAVQSNRSPVANISDFLSEPMQIEEFIRFLLDSQLGKTENKPLVLTEEDIKNINELAESKFATWDWIWGYSPKYSFSNKKTKQGKTLDIKLFVSKGIVQEASIGGTLFDNATSRKLEKSLIGCRHSYDDIRHMLLAVDKTITSQWIEVFF